MNSNQNSPNKPGDGKSFGASHGSRITLIERLWQTPKTDALADEIKRSNWKDWHSLEKMEEHAKMLERSENKLKHRIRQLLDNRGHMAAEAVMDKMAEEISSANGSDQGHLPGKKNSQSTQRSSG
jgi:hypothetical protein